VTPDEFAKPTPALGVSASRSMPFPLLVRFVGGAAGPWRVLRSRALRGAKLADASHVTVCDGGDEPRVIGAAWQLRGVVSHPRYVARSEAEALGRVQAGLGRPEATRAALIPIRKNEAWWSLAQDERRAIFEDRSHHIASTMRFLPAIARRLHHARDLGEEFDFITWFEFAPEHERLFDELVSMLRATEEWTYVDREVDIRLAASRDLHPARHLG
jgi:Chlorite dismutase